MGIACWVSAAPTPHFENPSGQVTKSGYFTLQWTLGTAAQQPTDKVTYEVQQATDTTFEQAKTLYTGPDMATFCSGYKNGNYYFRVRAFALHDNTPGQWSAPLQVQVKHHSLNLAFALFGLGALVFLITVGIVLHGNRHVSAPKS